ncbi:MAG: hypothetical protein CL764_06030 [Chloroflexi bacterium]|nr:hypothetical protein [Chloroflexota bacterium]|tara:strand:+ start:1333 stop:1989 length:657 start_codon:yes stop_codon:yes gene_type:complete
MVIIKNILIGVGAWFGVAIIISLLFGSARGTEYQAGFYTLNFINFAFWFIFTIVRISKINKNASEVNTPVSPNAPKVEPIKEPSVAPFGISLGEQPSADVESKKYSLVTGEEIEEEEAYSAIPKPSADVEKISQEEIKERLLSPEIKALQNELNTLKVEEKKAEDERLAQEEIAKKKKEEEKEIERLKKEIEETKKRIKGEEKPKYTSNIEDLHKDIK